MLSSMTKGEIVDEIVIDANMDKVLVLTKLDLDTTTLLKILKTLLMALKTLPMMMKSLVMMLKLLIDLDDNDTLNKMMMHDDLEGCGNPSYTLGYDQTL